MAQAGTGTTDTFKAPETTDVLIVGAGPTGLTLGCDLARHGVRARVIERDAALFPGSRGKGAQPRTMEVLHDLGVIDAFLAAGGPAPVGMTWQDGRRLGEYRMFEEQPPTEDAPYAGPWLVPQWRTQEILLARLKELGGCVEFGAGLTRLTQDADGVSATLADGRTVRARYAVGTDGGRSTVRRALGIQMAGESVDPNPLMVADVRIRASALDRDNWHIFPPAGKDAGFLSICPLPHIPDFQLVAQFAEGTEPDLSADGVRKVVAARTHLAAKDVTEVRWASDFRPRAALADRFRAGRVFLAGDAAHIHSPAGGQGLNTSIQDAYNLGWKLGAVLRLDAPEALLDTYEEERRPIAAQMLDLSTRIHHGTARRGTATRQLGIGYRASSLTTETRSALSADALQAGDRAPDGHLGGPRLFDVFRGPHWTLLVLGAGTDVPEFGAPAVHVHHAPAHPPYHAGAFLVRPDGYLGWAGDTTEGLTAYLARVGIKAPPAGQPGD